jgi:hypothetical protein
MTGSVIITMTAPNVIVEAGDSRISEKSAQSHKREDQFGKNLIQKNGRESSKPVSGFTRQYRWLS